MDLKPVLSTAGSGFNFLGNMANQALSYKANKRLQENQARLNYEYAEKSAINQPTWNRAGLESAGFNPMLAVQNATSGANSSWTSGAHADSLDTHLGTDMIANAQSLKRLDNETKTAEATQDEAYANADKAKAEKNTILAKLPYVSQREKAEISNIEKDSIHKEALIHQIDETIRLREKELELQEMGLNVQMRGQDKAYNAQTYGANMLYKANSIKTLPQYAGKWVDDTINKYSPGVKNWLFDPKRSKYSRKLYNMIK